MSHSLLYVVLPKGGEENPETEIERLLKPFDDPGPRVREALLLYRP